MLLCLGVLLIKQRQRLRVRLPRLGILAQIVLLWHINLAAARRRRRQGPLPTHILLKRHRVGGGRGKPCGDDTTRVEADDQIACRIAGGAA